MLECNVQKKNIIIFDLEKKYDIGKYIIEPVMAIHDVPNFGYKIIIKENNYKIFHISDTNSLKHVEAKNFDWYSVEGNYETNDELNKKIKDDKENGKFSYYERVKDTHLSQLDAINWLDKNMSANSKYIFIHQHENRKEEGK